MTRLTATFAALLATATLVLYSDGAYADCAQPPVSVPGLSGPPVWLPPTGGAPWRSQLQDPRWAGGPMQFFPVASGGSFSDQFDAQYRLVYSGNSLYVSIQVLADPGGIDGLDAVYFGITGGTASLGAYLLEIPPDAIHPQSTCSTTHDPACPIPNNLGPANYYTTPNRSLASPTWTTAGAPPPWLKNVATWTSSPGVAWAVTLQVDTTALTAGATQMFFGTRIAMMGGTTVLLTSSSQTTGANPPIGDTPAGVSITDWVNYDALGGACPAGITISSNSVGVWNGTSLTNAINTCPGSTCTNTFRVEAQNVPIAGSAPFAIRTRIRVADWGITIADPNAPWNDFGIPPDVFVKPPAYFTTPPWVWTQSGTTADIDYTCALDGVAGHGYCPWVPNAKAAGQQHQCMLVEIGLSPGVTGTPGWVIQTPAVYRNMDFGPLSTLSEPATISLKGLQKLTGVAADRDVYIYVEPKNMPPHGGSPMELRQEELARARQYAMHPPALPRPNPNSKDTRAVSAPSDALLDLPLLTGDQALSEVYPTYRVFGFYDSGKTIKVKGQVQKVLVPMAPFGFYLDHKGTFFGFNHSLEFLDAHAKEISPNFYVIHVPNEGEFHVRTNISAEDRPFGEPRPPPVHHGHHCNCDVVGSNDWSPLALGIAAFGVSALVVRTRRRRGNGLTSKKD